MNISERALRMCGNLVLLTLLIAQAFSGTVVCAAGNPAKGNPGNPQNCSEAMVFGGSPDWPDPLIVSAAQEKVEVPIIMYHLITKNQQNLGKYGITPKEMENDLIYLKDNGYETVLMRDLINYVRGEGELPEKPIVLTFDDGNSSDYVYLFPLLKKYGMKAVCSIVGKFTDENSKLDGRYGKPNLDWEQVKEMQREGFIEIQNHSYDMHGWNGSGKLKNESVEEYQARFYADLEKTQAKVREATGLAPTTFVYPLGVIGKGSLEVLKKLEIQASLSCWEGINIVTKGEPECLYAMRRAIRKGGQPVSDVLTGAYLRLKQEKANSA